MNFFSKLISYKTVNGNLVLTEEERNVLLDLAQTGVVSLNNNEVKLEKDISLITESCTINNVYFCQILPFIDCYLYVFTSEKPVLLTKYNYTNVNKYEKKIDEINKKLFDKNKFAILMNFCTKPASQKNLYTIKKVLATKNKNYLLEHTIDVDKLFKINVPFKWYYLFS